MNYTSLEKFHKAVEKHIDFAAGYCEKPLFRWLIQTCRLKPLNVTFQKIKPSKIYLEKIWMDEYGNCLEINSKKQLKIRLNTSFVPSAKIISTDLYKYLPLKELINVHSQLIYFAQGTDVPFFVLAFFCKDGYIRTHAQVNGKITQEISPLYLGLDTLDFIFNNSSNMDLLELPKLKTFFPFKEYKAFLGQANNKELLQMIQNTGKF